MQSPDDFDESRYFYAIRKRFFCRDQLFRVYVNREMLAAAYVAGQVRESRLYWNELARLAWSARLLMPFINAVLRWRDEREALYDLVDPFDPGFTTIDRRNFQIPADQILRIRFEHKFVLHVQECIGMMQVISFDRARLSLIVIGFEPAEQIIRQLRELDRGLEVDRANPYLSPFDRELANQRRTTVWSNFCLAMVAVVVFAIWATELVPRPRLLVSIAIGLTSCLWVVIKSRNSHRAHA